MTITKLSDEVKGLITDFPVTFILDELHRQVIDSNDPERRVAFDNWCESYVAWEEMNAG